MKMRNRRGKSLERRWLFWEGSVFFLFLFSFRFLKEEEDVVVFIVIVIITFLLLIQSSVCFLPRPTHLCLSYHAMYEIPTNTLPFQIFLLQPV